VEVVRNSPLLVLATCLALLAPRSARADDEEAPPTPPRDHDRLFYFEADARYAWTARPPALDVYEAGKNGPRIDGIRDGFVRSSSSMQSFGVHLALVLRPAQHLIVPLWGQRCRLGPAHTVARRGTTASHSRRRIRPLS
jgi:hypothetical protein